MRLLLPMILVSMLLAACGGSSSSPPSPPPASDCVVKTTFVIQQVDQWSDGSPINGGGYRIECTDDAGAVTPKDVGMVATYPMAAVVAPVTNYNCRAVRYDAAKLESAPGSPYRIEAKNGQFCHRD